jgi:SAM-dependent methyltransferase
MRKDEIRQWSEARPNAYMAALIAFNVRDAVRVRKDLGSSEIDHHTNEAFLRSIEEYFFDYLSVAELKPQDLEGLSVLELGTGDSYGVALKFIQHGARRVVCTDRFRSRRSAIRETQIYRRMLDTIRSDREKSRFLEALEFTDSGFRLNQSRIEHVIAPAESLDQRLRGQQFDLILSRATLEHVYDLDSVFRSTTALLRPGGRMVHEVDFRNHGLFDAHGPVYFLRFSDAVWRMASSHRSFPNRRRKSDFTRLTSKFGLSIYRMIDTGVLTDDEMRAARSYLPESRMSDEDLRVQGIFFAAQKTSSGR